MPVPFIYCRNEVTGGTAEIPETALSHMSDWVPTERPAPPPEDTAATRAARAAAETPPAGSGEPDPPAFTEPPTTRTAKSKAADTAKNTEEK